MADTTHTPKDGGQAYPQPLCVGPNDDLYPAYPGMSLRDYFAGQALAGLLAGSPDADCEPAGYAHDAYLYADALLKAKGETA